MKIVKLISFSLALLMVFYAVPLNAYAVVATEDKLAEQTDTYETGTNELCEVESTNPVETTVPEITTTETTVCSFDYDAFGNTTGIDIGNDNIVSYEYAPYNGKLTKINYANGYSLEYVYDAVENLTEIWYTVNGARALAYSYEYTAKGQLARVRDHINGNETTYRYSLSGQCVAEHTNPIGADDLKSSNDYQYDDEGRIKIISNALSYEYNGTLTLESLSSQYFYDHVGRMTGLSYYIGAVDVDLDYTYDAYDRPATSRLTAIDGSNAMLLDTAYTYRTFGNNLLYTDGLIATMTSKVTNTNAVETTLTYTYTYDANNNITKVVYSTGKEIRYVYDDLSQLVREDNGILNKTYTYTYDNAGNITSKKTYALTAAGVTPQNPSATDSYTYGDADWGDLLTAYKGQSITYDAIGNPLSYYNGARYTFSWLGRRLTGATLGSTQMTFQYREDGLRTKKTVGGVVTEYFYDGSLLIAEQTGDTIVMYYYDENGAPIAMQYRDSTKASNAWDKYIFEKNLQGDVVAIYSTSGTKLVSYTYDAWGNATVSYHNGGGSTSATYNRLTYRGYYYDTDLQLYYLQSRYYDAKVGRFINADDTEFLGANGDLNSYNLYAYCSNNPVMYKDPSGHIILGAILLSGVLGMILGATTSIIDQLWNNGNDWSAIHWGEVAVDVVTGAINGALAASSISTGGAIIAGALVGGGASIAKDLLFHGGNINWDKALFNAAIGGVSGIIAGAGADAASGGKQVTKYFAGKEILNRTVSNGSTHAIARQANALLIHGKELAISAFRYFAGNASAFFGTNLYPGR